MMTTAERIQTVADFGFTKRQACFLVLVMKHAGVCVPRQYARFAGVAYGAKCNAFFNKLVRRGYARASDCIHNRARLYQVHHKPLYHVIGEGTSRYRRPVSPRLAIERLMLLDAAPGHPRRQHSTRLAFVSGSVTRPAASRDAPPRAGTPDRRHLRATSRYERSPALPARLSASRTSATRPASRSGATQSASRWPCSDTAHRARRTA